MTPKRNQISKTTVGRHKRGERAQRGIKPERQVHALSVVACQGGLGSYFHEAWVLLLSMTYVEGSGLTSDNDVFDKYKFGKELSIHVGAVPV